MLYLKDAQDRVRNAAMYQPGAKGNYNNISGTWCNQSTYDILDATGADPNQFIDGSGHDRWNTTATQAASAMQNNASAGRIVEVNAETAQMLANEGSTVVVAGDGHLSTIRPSDAAYNPSKGPYISNVGERNWLTTVAGAWHNVNNVHFYYNPNQTFGYDPSSLARDMR